MILGTKARYAVMAMVDLAGREASKPVTLAMIAEAQEIPLPYLEQIFVKLKKCGLVNSVRGPGGGYLLAKPVKETRVSEIIVAVEEALKMTRCESHGTGGCMASKARCVTHDLWEGLGNHIYEYLSSVTLQDVCERRVSGTGKMVPASAFSAFLDAGIN